jgi:serine/threonine protein kinase
MVNIATIIRDQPIEGKMYYIIYDLADMDLEKFLTTSWLDNRKTRNNKSPRGRNFSYRVWPGELIMQIRHLADALDFLHNRMFDLERFTLVHNDLKPPNILVFYPNSADEDQRYPVGQWKIADFGLGKVKDSRKTLAELENRQSELHLHPNSSRPLPKIADFTHRQLSLTPAKRPAGKYTPPEVKEDGQSELNAKMGDVWAFGTVFSEVLAYAVDDVNQVLRLRKACQSDTEDRFFDPSTGELKKSFLDWMLKLHVKPRKDGKDVVWIQECTSLIKKILIRDASRRKSVAAIREDLDRIYWNHLEPKKLEWLSELQDDNRPSSRGSTDSPQEYDEEDYLRSPSSDTSRRGSFPPRVPTIHETHH